MPAKKYPVTLTAQERMTLAQMLRRGQPATRRLPRARRLLKAADGLQDDEMAAAIETSLPTVERTRQRFAESRLQALADKPRPGQQPVLDERGAPTPLAATLLCAPRSRMGPLTPDELEEAVNHSTLRDKYNTTLDPQSAYEILGGKIAFAASPEQAQRVGTAPRRTFTPGASAPRSRELNDALGVPEQSASPPADLPYPKAAPPAPPPHNRRARSGRHQPRCGRRLRHEGSGNAGLWLV